MLVSIPPKYSVAEVIGFIKGKSSIWIAQNIERKAKNFTGHKFWARGYFVSTVGRDEETIRVYIRNPGASGSPNGTICADPLAGC
jgi:putative transposase